MEIKRELVYQILRIISGIAGLVSYIYGMGHNYIFIIIGVGLLAPIIWDLFSLLDPQTKIDENEESITENDEVNVKK